METSDSDYFESADEEFSSDEDTTETENNSALSVAKKVKELSISSEIDDKSLSKKDDVECTTDRGKNVKEDVKLITGTTLKSVPPVQTEEKEILTPSTEDKQSKETNLGSNEELKVDHSKFGIPPARVGCWEEGVNNVKPRDNETKSHQDDSPTKFKTTKRPEFAIPPRRVECWVDGVNNVSVRPSIKSQEKKDSDVQVNEEVTRISSMPDDRKAEGNAEVNMWSEDEAWGEIDPKKKNEPEENMWDDDDDWEPVDRSDATSKQKEGEATKNDGPVWGGWTSWGLSTVLSTASTLTSQVSQSLGTVLETGIGVPEPEELARIDRLEKHNQDQQTDERKRESDQSPEQKPPVLGFRFGNLVQGVTQITKLMETTGNKVITGGLDTLETIGKKTMEVLQENDPGLKKKRAFLKLDDDKPILSQVLREAKEKAEAENADLEQKHFARKANYEMLFDDHQGLVHLEALEMLSRQCDIKLQTMLEGSTGDALVDMQETIDQVRELCELPDEDDEDGSLTNDEIVEKLRNATSELNVNITYDHLISKWRDVDAWLGSVDSSTKSMELHRQAIEALAQLTAIAVERFHKTGELLLIKERRSTADEADSLVQLTTTLTALIGVVAAKFTEKLNIVTDKEVNRLITNVFFEAANSSSYVQDAFQLLIPVIQVGALSV